MKKICLVIISFIIFASNVKAFSIDVDKIEIKDKGSELTNMLDKKYDIDGSNFDSNIYYDAKAQSLSKELVKIVASSKSKQEKISDKTSEKEVKYECFDPYNKTRLNLSICSGININIFVKLELSDDTKSVAETLKELGYDMFDINDEFYQDICATYKSTVDSDMLLTDRIDYIYYNDDAQCPDNCEFFSYFLGSLYINCSCSIDEKDEKMI